VPPRKRTDLTPPPAMPEPPVAPAPKHATKWTVRFSEDAHVAIGIRATTVTDLTISDGLLKLAINGKEYLVPLAAVLFIRRESDGVLVADR